MVPLNTAIISPLSQPGPPGEFPRAGLSSAPRRDRSRPPRESGSEGPRGRRDPRSGPHEGPGDNAALRLEDVSPPLPKDSLTTQFLNPACGASPPERHYLDRQRHRMTQD